MWGWLIAALLTAYFLFRSVTGRHQVEGERRERAFEAVSAAERERLERLPIVFAHYRERMELVRERLAAFVAEPAAPPDVDLDDWPRRARDFAEVLGPGSSGYHVLAAVYRGVRSLAQGADVERAEPVLRLLDQALETVDDAIDKALSTPR